MSSNNSEKLKQILVIAATLGVIAFNLSAAAGYVNGVTPEVISARYPTLLTPAGYAFMIWNLIYFGLVMFSLYQLLPKNGERFRTIRSLYILSCAANCAWLYFWNREEIVICLAVILALLISLLLISLKLRNSETRNEFWLAKAPFGIYFGWVTVAAAVNLAVVLKYLNVITTETFEVVFAVVVISLAAVLGVLVRIKAANYFYPAAIAWAVSAIAVRHGSNTAIVVAAAVTCIISLFTALSFVLVNDPKPVSNG